VIDLLFLIAIVGLLLVGFVAFRYAGRDE